MCEQVFLFAAGFLVDRKLTEGSRGRGRKPDAAEFSASCAAPFLTDNTEPFLTFAKIPTLYARGLKVGVYLK